MFLETPVIFDPVNFPGNLPGNLREVLTSRKVTGKSKCCIDKQNGGRRRTYFCLARRQRSNQRRPFLVDMADCEFIERFRLSLSTRIEWLIEEMKEELERNTARRSPLASEAGVNICCFIFKKLLYDPSVFPIFSTLS